MGKKWLIAILCFMVIFQGAGLAHATDTQSNAASDVMNKGSSQSNAASDVMNEGGSQNNAASDFKNMGSSQSNAVSNVMNEGGSQSGTTSDDTNPPVLENFTVSSRNPIIYDRLTMTAKVSDESGVSKVTAILHQFTDVEFEMTYNQDTGVWKVNTPLDNALLGTWTVSVKMSDTAGNETVQSCSDFVPYIVIINDLMDKDANPPGVRAITVNPMPVILEDPFTIRVKAVDDKTRVTLVEGELSDEKGDSAVTIPLSYDSNTDEWVATYTFPENTPLNVKVLKVRAKDMVGNIGSSYISFMPKSKYADETPPEMPIVNEITEYDTVVTGEAEPASLITVVNHDTIGEATTGMDGHFSVPIPAQPANSRLVIIAHDQAGNSSKAAIVYVKDRTPPAKPIVNEITDRDNKITGQAEVGGSIRVKKEGELLGTAPVNVHGEFSFWFPPVDDSVTKPAGTELVVTALDREGNESEPTVVVVKDVTPPKGPYMNLVTDQDTQVSGWTDSVATIEVKANGVLLGTTTSEIKVTFSIPIPQQKAGTILEFTATDLAGNVSVSHETVIDVTPPEQPVVNRVTDKDTVVTGEAEPGSTVEVEVADVIRTGVTGADGKFTVAIPQLEAGTQLSVAARDSVGNRSPRVYLWVADTTPPLPPVINEVNDEDTAITGVTERYSTVEVRANNQVIGSILAYNSQFTVLIPTQPAGTELTVTATDDFGNVSPATIVTVVKAVPILSGWVLENGKKYYYDPVSHVKKTGWFTLGRSTYYLDPNSGQAIVGWLKVGTSWYYFKDTGEMMTGWIFDGSQTYYLNSSGVMQTGWVKSEGTWFYLNTSGAMQKGWIKLGGVWYYLASNGMMKTGWLWEGNRWYYLNSSGAMATGWKKVGATWYYLNGSGTMVTGWLKSGTKWYYLNTSGAMVTGWVKIGGKFYYFDSSGALR